MKSFVNFSNHPSTRWSQKQLDAAHKYAEKIVDVPFPNVPADATSEEVRAMAREIAVDIVLEDPAAVMCQGEFSLAYEVARRLMVTDIPVVVACSERRVTTTQNPDGTTTKTATFDFVQFREVWKRERRETL